MFRTVKHLGFTMIELLVVIAVIGILAVALLASLNPLEQIRKGRDTRTRSDASQLASALERYNASLGRFPWQVAEGEDVVVNFANVKTGTITGCTATGEAGGACTISTVLADLTETNEVKSSFVDRVTTGTSRDMYIAYSNGTNSSVIVCFMPESNTFAREAFDRCKNGTFGTDFTAAYGSAATQTSTNAQFACPKGAGAANYASLTFSATSANELICLP